MWPTYGAMQTLHSCLLLKISVIKVESWFYLFKRKEILKKLLPPSIGIGNFIYMWFALNDTEVKVGLIETSWVIRPMPYFMYQALTMVVADSSSLGHKSEFTLLPLTDLHNLALCFHHVEKLPEEVWNHKFSVSRRKLNDII